MPGFAAVQVRISGQLECGDVPGVQFGNPASAEQESSPEEEISTTFQASSRRADSMRISAKGPLIGWKLAKEENRRAALRRQLLRPLPVATMYKRKADKVRPVDASDTDGSTPGGR